MGLKRESLNDTTAGTDIDAMIVIIHFSSSM